MSKENTTFDLSRRKVLGSLGALGAGAALGGAGTTAFFSDEEQFENNKLVAGALDLKVDWEEHYSDWSEDESEGVTNGVKMSQPSDTSMWVGLPDPQNPLIWVHVDDLGQFMDNTALEAYPDSNDDGIQDDLSNFDFCDKGADTPEDLDPNGGTGLRTDNDDTVGNSGYYPLVNLHDVKPGDFGELTLSYHLCDNPGYVWLNGGLVDASENGKTEPERKDPDEEDGVVELLDEIQTLLWYDEDGDNVYEPGGVSGEVDVVLVIDESGSMQGEKMTAAKNGAKDLIDALTLASDAGQVGVVSFQDGGSNPATLQQGLTTDANAAKAGVDAIVNDGLGRTNMEAGVEAGQEELTGDDVSDSITASGNDRDTAQKIMVFLGDGMPNEGTDTDANEDPVEEATTAMNAGIEIYSIAYGLDDSDPGDQSAIDTLESIASSPVSSHFFLSTTEDIENVFGQISQVIAGEECFFRGTLRELLTVLSDGNGIPLDANRKTPFDEINGDPTSDNRECFTDSTTNAIGLAWYLPVDHANEIQTDSVEFDLGFYTEQCRHNDGSGYNNANANS